MRDVEDTMIDMGDIGDNRSPVSDDMIATQYSEDVEQSARRRKINKGYFANDEQEEPNKVLDIVDEYYRQLLEKLRSHLMLEDVIQDEFEYTSFYNQLFEQLQDKLDKIPRNNAEEYNSLIKQAKFHLLTKYNDELFKFHKTKHDISDTERRYQEYVNEQNKMFFSREEMGDVIDSLSLQPAPAPEVATTLEKKAEDVNLHEEIQAKEQQALPMWRKVIKFLSNFFPVLNWLPEYRTHLADIKSDIIAGITIGAMLIPQGMGYSMIVGNPPIYGLYASLIPLFVYSVTGTSRQLAMGPTALCSIVLADGLAKLSTKPEAGSELYIAYSLVFGLVIGTVQLLCGIFRLGYLVNFMSYPVLSGFTSASAIIILFSQANYFFKLHMPQGTQLHSNIYHLAKEVKSIHVPSMLLGLSCLVFLLIFDKGHFTLKKQRKIKLFGREFNLPRHYSLHKIPGVLALVVVAIVTMKIVASITGQLDTKHATVNEIKIVGTVPSGLPKVGLPHLKEVTAKTGLRELLTICIPIGLVGYLEAISIGKFYALQNGYELDYNQELIAIGASNLLGSWVKVFPGSGSMPRTVVNANAGAKTQLCGFISGLCMICTLLFLTPLTYYLPKPALAAIIMYSCKKIFDYEQMIFTYKVKKRDFFLLFLAFFCTLFIGIAEGILIGIAASMALVIYRTTRPRFNKLGRVPGTNMYEEIKKSKDVIETPGVLVMRFDADLYFANITYFRHRIDKLVRKSPWSVYALVLDCSSINQSDSTAVGVFVDLKQFLDNQQIEFYAAGLKKSIRDVLKKGGAFNVFRKSCFPSLHEAVLRAEFSTRLRIAAKKDQEQQQQQQQQQDTTKDQEIVKTEAQLEDDFILEMREQKQRERTHHHSADSQEQFSL